MSESLPQNFVEITDRAQADLNGIVRFKRPNTIEKINIGRRMGNLAEPVGLDKLPRDAVELIEIVASLEIVITNAPPGWYQDIPKVGPLLSPGIISDAEEEVLYIVWNAYQRFRYGLPDAQPRDDQGDHQGLGSADRVAGRDQPGT